MRSSYGTALVALALAGCGREAAIRGSARPEPTPSVKVTPTLSSRDLGHALRLAAVSQEEYFTDNETYATDVTALPTSNLDLPPGVVVTVVSATATAYCLAATAEGVTLYFDSDVGRVQTLTCR